MGLEQGIQFIHYVLWGKPSNFAMFCFSDVKTGKVKKNLEVGYGCGGDTGFFASKGLLMSGAVSLVKVASVARSRNGHPRL